MPTDNDGWNYAEQNTKLGRFQVACGVVEHPVTHCWQTWISLYGQDATCIYASKKWRDAEAVRLVFADEWQSGNLLTTEAVVQFLAIVKALPGSELVDPLPRAVLEELRTDMDEQVKTSAKPKGFGKRSRE